MKKLIFCITFSVLTLFSCKEKDVVNPDNNNNGALNVLNDKSTFETIYDTAHVKKEFSGGLLGRMGIEDFTVSGNVLNLYYYTTVPTQQSESVEYFRTLFNMLTKQHTPMPAKAGAFGVLPPTSFGKPKFVYFPYSNILTCLQVGGGNGFLRYFHVNNDVNMVFETTNNALGSEDIARKHFVCNPSMAPGSGVSYGTFSSWLTNTPFGVGAKFQMFFAPPATSHIVGLNDVYKDASDNEHFLSFLCGTDSLFVEKYTYTHYGSSTVNPTYTTTKIAKLKHTQPITNIGYTRIRHYSTDGKKIAFGFVDMQTLKIYTYTYNYETNTLTQNLANATLDYASTDSDIDLDDDANVYYSGYASNGSNKNGVSIYKKSLTNPATVVGNDNFLKSGSVEKLKFINGKIYVVVIANQTGTTPIHQISVVKQK